MSDVLTDSLESLRIEYEIVACDPALADAAQISAPDRFGGRDLAFSLGFLVATALMVTGRIGWGRWLAHPTKTEPIPHTTA